MMGKNQGFDYKHKLVTKAGGNGMLANINGVKTGGKGTVDNYTMPVLSSVEVYVNPYFVVKNKKFTKHFYVGSQRILTKLGQPGTIDDLIEIEKVNGNGLINYNSKQKATNDQVLKHFKWIGQDGAILTAGQSGKIPPGILRKFTDLPADSIVTSLPNDKYERNQYYFHPDHLGSSSYITDSAGMVSQHTEYLLFGEISLDEHANTNKMPYLYNGKELDEETGFYYYGARYYDAQISRFHSIDPKAEEFNYQSPYLYAANNPIRLIDVFGMFAGPGDLFLSQKAAAADFGKTYNDNSIKKNSEYASSIYKVEKDGKTMYTYTTPNKGGVSGASPSEPSNGEEVISTVHSHGSYDEGIDMTLEGNQWTDEESNKDWNNTFSKKTEILDSDGDIEVYEQDNQDGFVTTPNGSLLKYDVKNNTTEVVSTEMPSDSNDPTRKNNIDVNSLPKDEPYMKPPFKKIKRDKP